MIGPFIQPTEDPEPFDKSKNSKILQRKQIQKRLQGLKPSEYEKIIANLESQNEKLKQEVQNITDKVQDLVQSKKINKNKNPQIEQEILRLKKELDLKYESMNFLKDSIKKQSQGEMTEDMKLKIKERSNIIVKYEKQFKELSIERQRLAQQISRNQEDINEFHFVTDPDGKIESIKAQNRELKQKIASIKTHLTQQEKYSQETIDKLYHLKDQQKEQKQQKGISRANRQISMSLKEIKRTSLTQINSLEQEIQTLKMKKKEVEKDRVTEKIIKQAKRGKLEKQVKHLLEFHKELYARKIKASNQFNFYEQRQVQLRLQLEKEAEKGNISYDETDMQTIKVVPLEFRKDWIGKSDGLSFNDAQLLEYRGESTIKAVTIYKSGETIVWTKFHYESPEKKKIESEPPFEKFLLKKFEAKKYESKTSAPLSNLILSSHAASKKIVRLEFKWADGEATVIGWDIEGSIRYPFDIMHNERPICMFGTVHPIGKFVYALETLGCEINVIDD